jgi:hypothetical protein
VVRTDEWKARIILNRTKYHLYCQGPKMPVWNTPWVWQLDREYKALARPIREMTDELKDRLDTLPTDEQRNAAAARSDEELKKHGWRE